MLPELSGLWAKIETRHQEMFDLIDELKPKQLLFKPEPDRWSMLQVLQHVVLGAQGMRRSEAEMRDNPLREILKPGEMVKLVKDVLVKDVPVDVPDPSMEPDGEVTVGGTARHLEKRAAGSCRPAGDGDSRKPRAGDV